MISSCKWCNYFDGGLIGTGSAFPIPAFPSRVLFYSFICDQVHCKVMVSGDTISNRSVQEKRNTSVVHLHNCSQNHQRYASDFPAPEGTLQIRTSEAASLTNTYDGHSSNSFGVRLSPSNGINLINISKSARIESSASFPSIK